MLGRLGVRAISADRTVTALKPGATESLGRRTKSVAIVQSNYIPWKGYFDLVASVDEFVLFDDAQYTRRDWRNRNLIKTAHGPLWLTIPVRVKRRFHQRIRETVVSDAAWNMRHFKTICHSYARAPYFDRYHGFLKELYLGCDERCLSLCNHRFLRAFCDLLSIPATFSWSMDYEQATGRNERLLSICKQAGATEYFSGPAARVYLDESLFAQEGIRVRWMDYSGYPEYPQLHPPFDHHVSVLDLILTMGPEASTYMKPRARCAVPVAAGAAKRQPSLTS